MHVDFAKAFCDLSGTVLENQDGDGPRRALTLDIVSVNALLAPHDDDRAISGDEKVTRYKLAVKIHKAGVVDVTAEDVALLKRLIVRMYPPLIVGQAVDMLETPATKKVRAV